MAEVCWGVSGKILAFLFCFVFKEKVITAALIFQLSPASSLEYRCDTWCSGSHVKTMRQQARILRIDLGGYGCGVQQWMEHKDQ